MNLIRRILGKWGTYFLVGDFVLVLVIAIGFCLWVELFGGRDSVDRLIANNRNNVYTALVSIFGSLLGFIITTMSIITTWAGRPEMERLRRESLYPQLWQTFQATIYALALAVCLVIFSLIFDKDSASQSWLWSISLFVVLLASIRTFRCVWLLRKLIDMVAGPLPPSDQP